MLAAASPFEDQRSLCPFLDTIAPKPLDIPFDGGDVPILVIGNPSDPLTPFTDSLELAEDTLPNGYLLDAIIQTTSCTEAATHASATSCIRYSSTSSSPTTAGSSENHCECLLQNPPNAT